MLNKSSKNNKTQPIDSHYAPKGLLTTLDAIKRVNASYSLLGHIMELGHSNIVDQAPNRVWGFQVYNSLQDIIGDTVIPVVPGDVFDFSIYS